MEMNLILIPRDCCVSFGRGKGLQLHAFSLRLDDDDGWRRTFPTDFIQSTCRLTFSFKRLRALFDGGATE
jgi:hypothetical protein